MSAIQGRPLELAVGRAAARYAKAKRCALRRQHVPWTPGRDGVLTPVGDAPIDFLGLVGPGESQYVAGRMMALECKETSTDRLPVEELHDGQRAALQLVHELGAITVVVVDFTARAEVYMVTWQRIAEFLAAPWRKSLSLAWFRAYGLVLPEENRGEAGRRTLFLEGREHWARAHAQDEVEAERLKSPVISLDPEEEPAPPPRVGPVRTEFADLTKEQIADRIIAAANAGLERQMKGSTRRGRWRKGGAR